MKLSSVVNIFAGVAAILILIMIFFPVYLLPHRHIHLPPNENRVIDGDPIYRKLSQELAQRQLNPALQDAIRLDRKYPRAARVELTLADIYYWRGQASDAQREYRKVIVPNGLIRNPADPIGYQTSIYVTTMDLIRFANLSEKLGHPEDARLAYRKVIAIASPDIGKPIARLAESASDSDLRADARALDAGTFFSPDFLQTLTQSVAAAPTQAIPHIEMGRVLARFNHRASAMAELDKGAKLLPPHLAEMYYPYWLRTFGFDAKSRVVVSTKPKLAIRYEGPTLIDSSFKIRERSRQPEGFVVRTD